MTTPLHACTALVRDAIAMLEPLDDEGEPLDLDIAEDHDIEAGQIKVIFGDRCFRVTVEVLS